MSNVHKNTEHGLVKCDKCDCLIVSDSSDSKKCISPKTQPMNKKGYQFSSGDADDSNSNEIILKPTCNSTIKIVVRAPCLDESTSTSDNPSTSKKDSGSDKSGLCFKLCRKKKKSDSSSGSKGSKASSGGAKPSSQKDNPPSKDLKRSHSSSGSKGSKASSEGPKPSSQQDNYPSKDPKRSSNQSKHVTTAYQTSKNTIKSANAQSSDAEIAEVLKQRCTACGKTGGSCNTNTIIFPRDKVSGDGALESMLKMEARIQSRNLEEILCELQRHRREIGELKELLDMVVRAMRDHLYMSAFVKGKNDFLDDYNKKINLERKSNTLSIDRRESSPNKKATVTEVSAVTDDKKRRGFFNWFSSQDKKEPNENKKLKVSNKKSVTMAPPAAQKNRRSSPRSSSRGTIKPSKEKKDTVPKAAKINKKRGFFSRSSSKNKLESSEMKKRPVSKPPPAPNKKRRGFFHRSLSNDNIEASKTQKTTVTPVKSSSTSTVEGKNRSEVFSSSSQHKREKPVNREKRPFFSWFGSRSN